MKQLPATTMQRETIPAKNGTFLTAITAQNVNNTSLQNTCQCCHWGKTQSVKHLCGQPALNQQQKHAEYMENPPEWSWTKTRNNLEKEFGAGNWWSKPLDPWAQDSKPSHARKILDHHKFPSFHVFPPHRHPAVWANRPPHPLKPQWQLLPMQYLHVLVTKRKKKTTLNSQRSQEVDLFYDRLQGYRVSVPPTSETLGSGCICHIRRRGFILDNRLKQPNRLVLATCSSSNRLAFNSVYIIVKQTCTTLLQNNVIYNAGTYILNNP